MRRKKKGGGPIVVVRCISCGAKRRIKPYEVPAGELPFCKDCGDVCVAVRAESRSGLR